ncbi:MAG: RNA pseudouridine synthase [Elusimicrobia bacterium]|nr:RNA pseudouridine synthase [Elusimicrobiota bacterium]
MESASLEVVFEDARLIAINKPVGQAVVPGRGLSEEPLAAQVGRRLGAKAFVVHRLDRDASGLTLLAKDAAAHRELSMLFEARRVRKLYLALVRGRLEGEGVIDRPLRQFGSGRMGDDPRGKPSATRWRLRAAAPECSLLEVSPETGRRHQIRAHLFGIGHPILGDRLYGKDRPVGGAARLMLHAWKLEFELEGAHYDLCVLPGPDFLAVLSSHGLSLTEKGP